MCPSLSKKNIFKNHLNRLKQGEGLLKIFAITKLKTYYGNALSCVTGLSQLFHLYLTFYFQFLKVDIFNNS